MLRPAAVSASSKTKSPDHSHNTANLIGVAMLCLLKYCNAVSIQVSFECWRPMENKLEIKENKLIHSHQSFFCPPLPLYKSSMGMGVSTSWGRKRRTEALGAEREGGRGGKREREREKGETKTERGKRSIKTWDRLTQLPVCQRCESDSPALPLSSRWNKDTV